jgi:hypothetical protein
MLRIALAIAAVVLATSAQAQTTETRTCRYNSFGGGYTCSTTTGMSSGSTALNLSRQELADQATRVAASPR